MVGNLEYEGKAASSIMTS